MYLLTTSGSIVGVVVWVAILAVFLFFFSIRPQKKEQARKAEMLNNMAVGDTVCTTTGFYGTLIDIDDDIVIVEFGNNKNCRIPMQKGAIAQIEKAEDGFAE